MRILSLRLHNIRSYLDAGIEFSEGTTLLSGDIGSGKTTILVAMEFAIFGFIKGSVGGSQLLRHGKHEGWVELDMEVQKKRITVRRNLRKRQNVSQESGYIIIDGRKEDLSTTELKSRMLEILGYPQDLLTKSKSLIFRYTVYTPQEEMKQILYESTEDRLETLRKLFNIDKYKRIRENAQNYIKELRTEKAVLQGRLEDEDIIKKEKEEFKKKELQLKEELEKKARSAKEAEQNLQVLRKEIEKYQAKSSLLEKEKDRLSMLKLQQERSMRAENELKEDIFSLEKEINTLNKELSEKKPVETEALKEDLQMLEKELEKHMDYMEDVRNKKSKNLALKEQSESVVEKIMGLDKCPTCQQDVDEKHKHHIREQHNGKLEKISKNAGLIEKIEKETGGKIKDCRERMQKLHKNLAEVELTRLKFKNVEEKTKALEKRKESLLKTAEEVKENKTRMEDATKQVALLEKELKDYPQLKEKLEKQGILSQEAGNILAQVRKELELTKDNVFRKEKKLAEKKEIREQFSRTTQLQDWLSKYVMTVSEQMELQIMKRIHGSFNQCFMDWFKELIDDDMTDVTLDLDFTPRVTQNGYETSIENLSGGEKTAVALSYRLALNKVINDFIGDIHTKDLLILDEPTDGFSSEQLDQLKEVLDTTQTGQVILVSHEAKLESYAEHIIRIRKHEHSSEIAEVQ